MSFPTFCDDFNIFFDDRFYNSYLLFLEAMVINYPSRRQKYK